MYYLPLENYSTDHLTFSDIPLEMGLKVHCGARTESFVGTDGSTDNESTAPVSALRFSNEGWDDLDVQMVRYLLL